jgi:beta-lactamase regulating signal transducer with metallopeptidase domain
VNSWISVLNSVSADWLELMIRATWQGVIVITLVWLSCRCVSAIPAACKVWLWRLAFLKLLVLLVWVTPVSLPVLPTRDVKPLDTSATPAMPSLMSEIESAPLPIEVSAPEMRDPIRWHLWLFVAWGCGVLWGLSRLGRQWRSALALVRSCEAVDNRVAHDMLARLCAAFALRRAPVLYQSGEARSPMLIGAFRPRIVLPKDALDHGLTPQVEMMLAHELAHVRRADLAWLWLLTFCEILFFFHPLVWVARREAAVDAESACDELALKVTGRDAHEYGSMLVDVVAQMRSPKSPAPLGVGMFESVNTLKRRLKAMTTSRNRFSTILGVLLVGVTTLAIVPCRLVAETPEAETLARLKEENAKLKEQLETTRAEMEAMAARQRALQYPQEKSRERQADLANRLEFSRRELEELQKRFAQNHPKVLAQQREVERLQKALDNALESERPRDSDFSNGQRETRNIGRASNSNRDQEQRALLREEIRLAERQVEFVRKLLENGKELPTNLLNVQRELLDLRLQLAQREGSKAEQHAVLLQQLKVAEDLLKEQKKRVEVGTLSPGAELPFEREVLRLKRSLMSSERGTIAE